MTMPRSRMAYPDVEEIFDIAMADPVGARVWFESRGQANNFITRAHTFRDIDRYDNARIFEKGEPLYGKSTYDILVLTVTAGAMDDPNVWVYVRKRSANGLRVERLSEVDAVAETEPQVEEQVTTMPSGRRF